MFVSLCRRLGFVLVLWFCICAPAQAQQTVGLFVNEDDAFAGYTLFAPRTSVTTYLIDNAGRRVHSWDSAFNPGMTAYLLPNGNLLRAARDQPAGVDRFQVGGAGGRIEEFAWDNTLVWSYLYSSQTARQHHDIEVLPNGNVLMIAWELKTSTEAIAAGRDPALLTDGELWPESIVEIQPVGASGGIVVWEWHVWDHLIQDFDPTRGNFGVVADHPELVNLNHVLDGPNPGRADWLHVNGIDYNEELDQILIGSTMLHEIWVIDHGTSTAEAAGHTGGPSGRGGDLLYRWGNPQVYDRGDAGDQKLFGQHDPRWIDPDLAGAGNLLVFNNGGGRPGGDHSSVDELVPPVDSNGDYLLPFGGVYDPPGPTWTYVGSPPESFFSQILSGAQRLPNGNTLICAGRGGELFEVTPAGQTVWRYVNPVTALGPVAQGTDPGIGNDLFRAWRHAIDDPAFDGRELVPGDPIELFFRPRPVPDGSGGTTPMRAARLNPEGDAIQIKWDASSCSSNDYNLLYGDLADVADRSFSGAECAIGIGGAFDWFFAPGSDLFFLVVGTDGTGVYESRWGNDGAGVERNAGAPSGQCAVSYKDLAETCP